MARNRPAKHGKRRILVLANEAIDGATRQDAIKPGNGETRVEVLVIAPALNSRLRHWISDEDEARRSASARLAATLEHLRTAGVEAEGRVGDPDPVQAITDALHRFEAHEIVIATNRDAHPHWLARDLVGRARRRFIQPVAHVVAKPSADSKLVSESTTRGRPVRLARSAQAPPAQGANA